MPMEGKVMTPKAAQSSCGGKQELTKESGCRDAGQNRDHGNDP